MESWDADARTVQSRSALLHLLRVLRDVLRHRVVPHQKVPQLRALRSLAQEFAQKFRELGP